VRFDFGLLLFVPFPLSGIPPLSRIQRAGLLERQEKGLTLMRTTRPRHIYPNNPSFLSPWRSVSILQTTHSIPQSIPATFLSSSSCLCSALSHRNRWQCAWAAVHVRYPVRQAKPCFAQAGISSISGLIFSIVHHSPFASEIIGRRVGRIDKCV